MKLGRWSVLFPVVLALGCTKPSPPSDGPAASASTRPVEPTTAPLARAGDASTGTPPAASGAANSAAAGTMSFSGAYTTSASTLYIPEEKDWKNVKQAPDDGGLLGEGTLSLTVVAGRVEGTTEGGALGASIVNGVLSGDTLTGTIRRADPSDQGLTGTLNAKLAGDTLTGVMKLAEANAARLREAKFSLKKK